MDNLNKDGDFETQQTTETIYRMPEVKWFQIWPKLTGVFAGITIMMAIGLPLLYSLFVPVNPNYVSTTLPLFGILMIVWAIVAVPLSISASQRQRDYQLVISDNAVISRVAKRGDWTIPYDEIAEIQDSPSIGLVVKAGKPTHAIGISRQLIGFDEMRERLNQIKPITPAPATSPFGRFALIYNILFLALIPLSLLPVIWIALPAILILGGMTVVGVIRVLQAKGIPMKAKVGGVVYRVFFLGIALIALLLQIARLN